MPNDTVTKEKSSFWPVSIVCLFMFIITPALTYFSPPQSGPVAVIFPFHYSAHQSFSAITQTNARLIRTGLTGNILIVDSAHPSFNDTIKSLGAWAVVNPLFLGGCQGRGNPKKI